MSTGSATLGGGHEDIAVSSSASAHAAPRARPPSIPEREVPIAAERRARCTHILERCNILHVRRNPGTRSAAGPLNGEQLIYALDRRGGRGARNGTARHPPLGGARQTSGRSPLA